MSRARSHLALTLAVLAASGCAALTSVLPQRDPTRAFRDRLSSGAAQDDTLGSGLVTDTDAVDAEPPGYRVRWVKWDSGFRGSGLQPSDRIVAIDGEPVTRPATMEERQHTLFKVIGQYGESQRWKERGVSDGATVTLTVRRRLQVGEGTQQLDVRGVVANARTFRSDSGRSLMGPGGPDEMSSDGFTDAWTGWYDQFVSRCQRVLDGGWQSTMSSRSLLAEHLADQARVDYAVQHYPGPFADALKADFAAVRESLAGRHYTLDATALAYRQLGDARVAQIAEAGGLARDRFIQALAAQTIPAFPTIDPIRGNRKQVIGKVVVLPAISYRDWVSEAGHGYLAWNGDGGWYFLDSWSPSAMRLFAALPRYRRFVSPRVDERYAVIARIRPEPKMVVVNGRAVTGLSLEVLGASVGDALFVDASKPGVAATFAGEDSLVETPPILPRDDASPRQVMEAFIAAIKMDDQKSWQRLYATWRAERAPEDNKLLFYPYYEHTLDREWTDSRQLILDRVYDARVVYVSDVERIAGGTEQPNGPVIDQVGVELDHIGSFDGEYHAFDGVAVHRLWTLQRIGNGPWRIASAQGL